MTFLCRSFSQLSLVQLYALLALRQEIFIVEQDCPYLDADGKDQESWHLLGFDDQGNLSCYARLLPQGLSYPDYLAIGRVVVSQNHRGTGIGKVLMQEAIDRCYDLFEQMPIKVSAQAHLEKFYNSLGFEATGETYLEDGIPHIGMVKQVERRGY